MTKRDFFQWLAEQGCEVKPKEWLNNSSPPVEIINKKTGRYSYFAPLHYPDGIPKKAIEKLVRDLGISPPKIY